MKAGCNLLRFTFPQQPKGIETEKGVIPSEIEKDKYKNTLENLKKKYENDNCSILIVDADADHDIYNKPRTVPCYARYIFPTVGFEASPDVVSDSPHLTEIHKSLIGHSSLCFSEAH